MRKIAVSLSKGGTGKTTTAVNLSAGLANAGYKVLIIDSDTQDQVAKHLGIQAKLGLAEVLLGEATPEQAISEARTDLQIMTAGKQLAGAKRMIAQKEFGAEMTMNEELASLDGQYDYIIVDTSPGWDTMTINALFYVQEVLAPVSLEVLTLQGVAEFTRNLARIQKYHEKLSLRYILPTFFDRRVKKSEEILSQLNQHYGDQLLSPIRYNVRLSEAPGYGQTIYEYAPKAPGAEDYQQLTERIASDGTA